VPGEPYEIGPSGYRYTALRWTRADIQRSTLMADDESGPKAGAEGIIEDIKGKAKEVVGKVTGNENLEREGGAQQDKADAERDVAKKEAEAEKARGEAEFHEAAQRVHQRAKDDDKN
jgi:uncharacterized protein YjbJ (UPF0337 family)